MRISIFSRIGAFLCVAAAALVLTFCTDGNNLLGDAINNISPDSSSSAFSSPSGESSSSEGGDGGLGGNPPQATPPSTFTVSFNIEGGDPIVITLDSGSVAYLLFPSDPNKEGYTFDGWFSPEGDLYTQSKPITKNVTLTPKWTPITPGKAIVSFYTDGGIPSTIEPVELDVGSTLGAEFPAAPVKAGATFDGWFAEGVPYTETTPFTENIMLTAKWIMKSYTVTFSRNGGTSTAINPVSVDSGSTLGAYLPAPPTRSGYDFAGWFDSQTDGNEYTEQSIVTGGLALIARWAAAGTLSSSSTTVGSSSSRSSSSVGASASSSSSNRSSSSAASIPVTPINPESFKEKVGNVEFDMVYIPGGSFTLGCEKSSGCPADAAPVSGVTVSNYFIGKTEVTVSLYNAVMGSGKCTSYTTSCTSITWYDAMEFACKLGQMTGKNYRMTTEAEWEYAAKKYASSLSNLGGGSGVSGEEWAYNSWNGTHTGGVDPIGPKTIVDGKVVWGHTQKTRRDPNGTADNITGRLIRSIEGVGPALRLALSKDVAFPPDMTPTCNIHAPVMGAEPTNSYRDMRWVTGSDKKWSPGSIAIGNFSLSVWEDGTAKLGSTNGQWFTSNNFTFVFVPSSGSITKLAYIFLDETEGSLISDKSFMSGGYIGRIVKESGSVAKPSVSGLKSGKELAQAQADFNTYFKMVDMTNIPSAEKKQDSRLLDGTSQGWFQDNRQAGGVHHYRKDVDPDEFRFTVNQLPNSRTMLANGTWFTVNNTFLRVTHSGGYTADYLYAVDSDGTFYHNSFMGYERGDFRMFKKTANNSDVFNSTCRDVCSGEIPKGQSASMYSSQGDIGKSTFKPAPCPSGGCN